MQSSSKFWDTYFLHWCTKKIVKVTTFKNFKICSWIFHKCEMQFFDWQLCNRLYKQNKNILSKCSKKRKTSYGDTNQHIPLICEHFRNVLPSSLSFYRWNFAFWNEIANYFRFACIVYLNLIIDVSLTLTIMNMLFKIHKSETNDAKCKSYLIVFDSISFVI